MNFLPIYGVKYLVSGIFRLEGNKACHDRSLIFFIILIFCSSQKAVIDMTYIAVEKMRKDKGGTIVNVSSGTGRDTFMQSKAISIGNYLKWIKYFDVPCLEQEMLINILKRNRFSLGVNTP